MPIATVTGVEYSEMAI